MAESNSEKFAIGRRIQRLRCDRGLTQADLALRAKLPLDTLRSVEQGRTKNPGILVVVQLAEALQISLDELVYGRT